MSGMLRPLPLPLPLLKQWQEGPMGCPPLPRLLLQEYLLG